MDRSQSARWAMAAHGPGPDSSQDRRFKSVAVSIDIRDRVLRVAAVGLVASVLVAVPLSFAVSGYLALVPLVLFLVWVPLTLTRRLRWWGPHLGAIDLRGEALEVTVNHPRRGRRVRRYALSEVKRGFRTDDEVRLETRRGETIALYIDSAAMGEEVLRAARQDARQRVLEVPLASIASRVPGVTTLAWLAILFQGLPGVIFGPIVMVSSLVDRHQHGDFRFTLAWTLVEASLFAACIKLLRRRPVVIGADGIRFRRFFRRRFYPYGAITDVALQDGRVSVTLRTGERLLLRTASWWPRSGLDETALALLERIEAARAVASPPRDVRAKLPLLERRGRPRDAWRTHLASLLDKAGYRTGALTAQDLTAVIEDTSLSAEHRVAAVVALSAAEPEEARTRARIAAAACADDDLREALDCAAEGELSDVRLDRLATRVRG